MKKTDDGRGSNIPAFTKYDADRSTVLSTDQVAAPNDEFCLGDMGRAPELYLRPMQKSLDMGVKPVRRAPIGGRYG